MILVTTPEKISPSWTFLVKPSMIFWASSAAAPSWEAIVTMPPSSISIFVLVLSVIPLMVLPPGPITVPISSGSILKLKSLGAWGDNDSWGLSIASCIFSKICNLAGRAFLIASEITDTGNPVIFISICNAVIPFSVPATLKSISPRKSSIPWMSVRILISLPSFIKPIAVPLTGALRGTPASSKERVLPQTEPIEVDPLELKTSLTTLST